MKSSSSSSDDIMSVAERERGGWERCGAALVGGAVNTRRCRAAERRKELAGEASGRFCIASGERQLARREIVDRTALRLSAREWRGIVISKAAIQLTRFR